jgi:multiple sugar transport system permease protein
LINRITRWIISIGVLGVVVLYFLLPLWFLVVTSTKEFSVVFTSNPLWFAQPTLHDFEIALSSPTFPVLQWFVNSVVISVAAGVLGAVLSAMAGYALAKFRFRGRDPFMLLIVVALMVPSTAIAFPIFVLDQQLGLINTYEAVILPMAVSAFGAYFMEIFAEDSIPKEVLEAARIDGASELRIFGSIVLRFFKPAMITLFVIIFGATYNNFLLPLFVLRETTSQMLPEGLTTVVNIGSGSIATGYEILFAGSVIAIIPLIVLVLTLEKYIESGLSLGALKG